LGGVGMVRGKELEGEDCGEWGWGGDVKLCEPADASIAFMGSNPAPEPHVAPKCIKMEVMQLFDRITWNPNQMNGQPCIRGMRLTVRRVVEAVAIYPNRDDLFRNYPELEPEDVRQALAFAAASLEDSATESNAA